MPITISMNNPEVNQGDAVTFIAGGDVQGKPPQSVTWAVVDAAGNELGEWIVRDAPESDWRAVGVEPGVHFVRATAKAGRTTEETTERIYVRTRAIVIEGHLDSPVRVDLQRAAVPRTTDLALWEVIRRSTEAISFDHYSLWMDYLFCDGELPSAFHPGRDRSKELSADGLGSRWHAGQAQFRNGGVHRAPLPFPDIDGYKVLKAATETFLEFNSGVVFDEPVVAQMHGLSEADRKHLGLDSSDNLQSLWGKYLIRVGDVGFIPYLYRVRQKLHDVQLTTNRLEGELCDKILETKFTNPFLLELIWSYWHEEGMLVETMNAISRRFQNRHGPREADPLANLTIGPLRPLSNLLWGYVQDEQHRLTPDRIGYEYKQNYGRHSGYPFDAAIAGCRHALGLPAGVPQPAAPRVDLLPRRRRHDDDRRRLPGAPGATGRAPGAGRERGQPAVRGHMERSQRDADPAVAAGAARVPRVLAHTADGRVPRTVDGPSRCDETDPGVDRHVDPAFPGSRGVRRAVAALDSVRRLEQRHRPGAGSELVPVLARPPARVRLRV